MKRSCALDGDRRTTPGKTMGVDSRGKVSPGQVLGVGAPVVTEDEGQRLVMEGPAVPGERRGLWQVHSAPGPPPSLPLDTNEGGRRLPEVQTYRILFLK